VAVPQDAGRVGEEHQLFGLQGSQNPFSGTPTYKSIASLPLAERVAAMRTPELRARILSEDRFEGSSFALIRRLTFDRVFPFGDPPDYTPPREASIALQAAARGITPEALAYDLLLEDEGHAFLFAALRGTDAHAGERAMAVEQDQARDERGWEVAS
jgi:hypothetical protein